MKLTLLLSWPLALAILTAPAVAPAQSPENPPAVTLPAATLQQYTGTWHRALDPTVLYSFSVDAGQLFIEGERLPRQALAAQSADHFFVPNEPMRLVFQRDAAGHITSIIESSAGSADTVTLIRDSNTPQTLNHFRDYAREEVMIPVRDGARLHAVILRPAGSEHDGEPLPFLLTRTPYGVDGSTSATVNSAKPELARSGYIFVFEDIRGRYKSDGQFVMNRPIVLHTTPHDIDETTDTHDTIDWLLKHVPNNSGRVGVLGVSYPGFLAISAGIDHHPAVKAISPQAPMTNIWLGDDFFHNGAFRETYGFDYVQQLEAQKTDVRVNSSEDTYNFFLKSGNFRNAAASASMTNLPTAKVFLRQPAYTAFWKAMAIEPHLTRVEVPTLEVGGWWDQEDMWGPQAEYAALKPHDTQHEVFLVLGPWNHGGWGGSTQHLGVIDFGSPTTDQYRKTIEAPFFEKYLKDRSGFDLKDTASFRTGVNQWQHYDIWPPQAGFHPAKLFLAPSGSLTFTPPASAHETVSATYISNPADPIPYRHRPIQPTYGEGSKWRTWLVEDQRFVSSRKDLANFTTPVLDHDVTVTGDILADLYASTSGTDSDWIVKLIDVYPDDAPAPMAGYQLMIADEIFRGRYVHSFSQPEPLPAGKVVEYKYSLHGADHTFLKGHRIMVEVQSTWFPLYDRNPQTYVPNIMSAPPDAYRPATQTIYTSAAHPSHIEFLEPDQDTSGTETAASLPK